MKLLTGPSKCDLDCVWRDLGYCGFPYRAGMTDSLHACRVHRFKKLIILKIPSFLSFCDS